MSKDEKDKWEKEARAMHMALWERDNELEDLRMRLKALEDK